jgi:hypothetical protein
MMDDGEGMVPDAILEYFESLGWVLYSTAYPSWYPRADGGTFMTPAVHGFCNRDAPDGLTEIHVSLRDGVLRVDDFVGERIFSCSLADPGCFDKLNEGLSNG